MALFSGMGLVTMSVLLDVSFGPGLFLAGLATSVYVFASLAVLRKHFGTAQVGPSLRATGAAGLALLAILIATLTWYWIDARDTEREKEAAGELIEDLDRARRESDIRFLLDMLHPVTFDYWSVADCRQSVSRFLGERAVATIEDVKAIGDGQIDYGNGRVAEYEDGYLVAFTNSDSAEGSARVAFVDSEARWFTNCDQPVQ